MKKQILFLVLIMCSTMTYSQIKVLANGNVGIGNSNPSTKLVVQSSGTTYNVTYSASQSSASALWTLNNYPANGTGTGFGFGVDNTGKGHIFRGTLATPNPLMSFSYSNGNVSIGSTTIDNNYRLKVYAESNKHGIYSETNHNDIDQETQYNLRLKVNRSWVKALAVTRDNVHDTIWLSGSGEGKARAWTTSSDIRYKDNIVDVNDANTKIMSLRPVYFSYRQPVLSDSLGNSESQIPTYNYGLIAQEVNSIIPEAVHADNQGYMAIDYAPLVALLIEAYKEQDQRIIELETILGECCATIGTKSTGFENSNNEKLNTTNGKSTLYQNQPNPFNKKTTIRYYISEIAGTSSLLVFDMQGKLVKTYPIITKGDGNIEINANELQPGMYMYSLITGGNEIDTKRMILTE